MDYIAQPKDYWIAPNAVYITRNALSNPNRIQGSVASGAAILCYIEGVAGLGYDNGHRFRTWPLTISPTYFNSNTAKYVYVAIPRSAEIGTQAIVVFPSEKLDIYGVNVNNEQVGSIDYYYIWLQGILTATDGTSNREWQQHIDFGRKGTDEDLYDDTTSDWYQYSKVSGLVTFLKDIAMKAGTTFHNLILGNKELTGVATALTADDFIDSDELVATPSYINARSLSKTHEDVAAESIGFLKGLWVKGKELFGFDQDGNIKANNVETVGDTVVGGLLTALRSVINHAQSDNYTGGELTGTGWRLTADDGSGHSKLEVDNIVARMKFVASVLEARKYVALGGNYVYSPAASIIERVDYINHYDEESYTGLRVEYIGAECYEYPANIHMVKGQTIDVTTDNAMLYVRLSDGSQFLVQGVNSVDYTATEDCDVRIGCFTADTRLNYTLESVDVILGYETLNMPWILRKMPMWMASKLMSRKKMVKTTVSDEDKRAATVFRCWIKADDGTTRTVNTWQKGMLARCQTMDVSKSENGTHTRGVNGVVSTKNTYYWREVVAALSGYLPISDGMIHSFVELSNAAGHYDAGSDLPSVGDSIVCFGATKKQYSNIIVIETVGADAPAFKEFRGVGLQDITRDNTNAELPRFSTKGRQFTKISPSTGNDFYAPHFYIETISGTEEVGYSLSRLRVDMNGIESTVTNLSNQNLLTGLADGEGWWHDESDFDASHVKFSSKGQVLVSIDGSIETPSIELPAGQYTFSCIGETAGTDYHFTVSYFENGQWYDLDDFDIEEGEDIVFTFSLTVQRIIQIEVYTDLDAFYISYPKLEYGTIATSFNMDSEVNYSRIRQTAESIEMKVKNTGIDIDQDEINLTAGKVKFLAGDGSANPHISINPTSGELDAKGGNFEQINVKDAVITGSLMYRNILFSPYDYGIEGANLFERNGDKVSLLCETFVITGQKRQGHFYVSLPPASMFHNANIRIINATYKGANRHEKDLGIIDLAVNYFSDATNPYQVDVQGYVTDNFVSCVEYDYYAGNTDYILNGGLDQGGIARYNTGVCGILGRSIYEYIELVSVEHPFTVADHDNWAWMIVEARKQ